MSKQDKNKYKWQDRFASLKSAPEDQQDAFIQDLAQSLDESESSPFLWAKIENSIQDEKEKSSRWSWRPTFASSKLVLRIAAAIVVMVGAGLIWQQFQPVTPNASKGLLTDSALAQVEQTEQAYEKAISALEESIEPKLEKMNLELMFLYRDKLATIDEQLDQCREALRENPGNAHVRRYMLAALQDKKDTLLEISKEAI